MKCVSVLLAAFLAIAALDTVNAQGFKSLKCAGHDITVSPEHIEIAIACANAVGVSKISDITMTKIGCLVKCFMEKLNVVDENGMPHKENIMKALDEGLPEPLVEPWKIAMENCLDTAGRKIKPNDPKCDSYIHIVTCLYGAYRKVCKS